MEVKTGTFRGRRFVVVESSQFAIGSGYLELEFIGQNLRTIVHESNEDIIWDDPGCLDGG